MLANCHMLAIDFPKPHKHRNVVTKYKVSVFIQAKRSGIKVHYFEFSLFPHIELQANSGNGATTASVSNAAYPLLNDSDDNEDSELLQRYETISIQLLDLMHTLHTRTAQIFRWWAEESGSLPQCSALWALGWCPILQGIARLATDQRRQERTSAVTCLQRSLLVHDLQTLSGPEWESCFKQVKLD